MYVSNCSRSTLRTLKQNKHYIQGISREIELSNLALKEKNRELRFHFRFDYIVGAWGCILIEGAVQGVSY